MLIKGQNGNVLLVTVGILTVVWSFAVGFLWINSGNSEYVSAWTTKKQTLYANESVRNISTKVLQGFAAEDPSATQDEIADKLRNDLPGYFQSSNFELDDLQIAGMVDLPAQPLPTGQFRGLIVPSRQVNLSISISGLSRLFFGDIRSTTRVDISLFKVSPFQYMIFSDLQYIDFHPGVLMTVNGRLHANGSICLSSNEQGMLVRQITASGRVMIHHNSNPKCLYKFNGLDKGMTRIATSASDMTGMSLLSGVDSGCTNCAGSGLNWSDYAQTRWNGQLHDVDHGVFMVRFPFADSAFYQTPFRDPLLNVSSANHAFVNSMIESIQSKANGGSIRFLVDPPQSGESQRIGELRLANIADIRILDGVWYLKNLTDPFDFPGIAVWSDHPGSNVNLTIPAGYRHLNVGQTDLRLSWMARGFPWRNSGGVDVTPKLFSHFAYDTSMSQYFADSVGVITYGGLELLTPGSSPVWRPLGNNRLEAARKGFRNPHIMAVSSESEGIRFQRSRILPINFDVSVFQQALNNATPGELGSYFGAGSYFNRKFNGVVYISASWPGSLKGFSDKAALRAQPDLPPLQGEFKGLFSYESYNPQVNTVATPPPPPQGGSAIVVEQPPAASDGQQALPVNLCSTDASLIGTALGGGFKVPDCADYVTVDPNTNKQRLLAYPNAIRVYNSTTLNKAILTQGLTIATNLPMYQLGNFNKESDPTDASDPVNADRVAALLASDMFYLQSNSWRDTASEWSSPLTDFSSGGPTRIRIASSTTVVAALLSGWTRQRNPNWQTAGGQPEYSVGANAFTGPMEDWQSSGAVQKIRGSIAIGYHPVYTQHGAIDFNPSSRAAIAGRSAQHQPATYLAPFRDWSYDQNFIFLDRQPPGTPLFPIAENANWQRDKISRTAQGN